MLSVILQAQKRMFVGNGPANTRICLCQTSNHSATNGRFRSQQSVQFSVLNGSNQSEADFRMLSGCYQRLPTLAAGE